MTRPAPSCSTEDNTRADGLSGHQIYTQMTGGPGTGSAQAAAVAAAGLERSYAAIEGRLKRVGETLGESWTGASADAAQAAANPINAAMIQMQDSLRQADHSLSNQVYQFNLNKGQLKNMPANKPDTGFWDDVSPWDTDAEDAANQYGSDEAHNRKVYSEFQSASNTNRGELPKEFPGVTADNLNVEVVDTGGNNGEDKTTNTSSSSSSTKPSSTGFPSTTGSPQGPTGTWTPPGTVTGDTTNTSWTSGGKDGVTKPGSSDLGGKPLTGGVIDRPPNAGLPPIGVPGGPGLTGPGGPSGGGRGPGGAGGGKVGGGTGGGAGGKFGGGLAGTGTGGSGTAGQQPGGKSGVFGGMGESANARGGVGGTTPAGRGGAAGMGGMGGAGAKGQGDEDSEHKTADYLITEENTNEIIGDMPMVAPPTIGG
ncbi:PPE domain-containing protein [Lentzea sp. NPDC051213]|uniref:PPE domain-containing protein n=1 Tax=Lentzea sp. NPDC051213 TaxID=3364126 RepID=UPI0037B7D41A